MPVRPGGLVAAGTALIATCYGLARFTYGLFSPDFAAEFSLGPLALGILGSGSYVGYCVAILASSALTPRWGARCVGVLAGASATIGILTVATASSAPVLAVGLLLAGSSTGIASPPMAAAVGQWIAEPRKDQAQTLVNAGTGLGVLVSGPIALASLAQWRVAWALFGLIAALVTVAVWRYLPPGRPPPSAPRPQVPGAARVGGIAGLPAGTSRLLTCSVLLGLGSVGVWTLGRQAITDQGRTSLVAAVVWTTIGAAGIAGALAGPAVDRLGLARSWVIGMTLMAAGTLGLALLAAYPLAGAAAAAAFGGAYIALTGVLLVWSTRLFPDRTSLGVGLSFLLIAAGQAVGSPLAGAGVALLTLPGVLVTCAAVAGVGALAAPRR